jgi:phage terminase large subunit-like protein
VLGVSPSAPAPDWRSWSPEDKAELRWRLQARPNQLLPEDEDWSTVIWLAGRGFGKTRCLTEAGRRWAATPRRRIAIVAPTFADARDTVVEGDSGLLAVLPPQSIEGWNRSLGDLRLRNGTTFKLFSADVPERLRGPQFHYALVDELGAFLYSDSWHMLKFGLRLGSNPRIAVATTPRRTEVLQELVASANAQPRGPVRIIRGSTRDNAANLAPMALSALYARYEGTRLGRQELEGELLEDVEGALFRREDIDAARLPYPPGDLTRVVVGFDPALSTPTESEDARHSRHGIVVAGIDGRGHAYVMEDASARLAPEEAVQRACSVFHRHHADRVVIEKNNGGDYLPGMFRLIDPSVPVRTVWASRGKQIRAEPLTPPYEQRRVHHCGPAHLLHDLEEEMCTWDPYDRTAPSPDRLDALVWALHELLIQVSNTEAFFAQLAPPCLSCGIPVREGTTHQCVPAQPPPARLPSLNIVPPAAR